jgi:hypothetical protein
MPEVRPRSDPLAVGVEAAKDLRGSGDAGLVRRVPIHGARPNITVLDV